MLCGGKEAVEDLARDQLNRGSCERNLLSAPPIAKVLDKKICLDIGCGHYPCVCVSSILLHPVMGGVSTNILSGIYPLKFLRVQGVNGEKKIRKNSVNFGLCVYLLLVLPFAEEQSLRRSDCRLWVGLCREALQHSLFPGTSFLTPDTTCLTQFSIIWWFLSDVSNQN